MLKHPTKQVFFKENPMLKRESNPGHITLEGDALPLGQQDCLLGPEATATTKNSNLATETVTPDTKVDSWGQSE